MRNIRDCNVCVVGGAGFLGSHLVNHLTEDRNCRVMVVDNLVAGRREFVHEKAEFVHHDITGSEDYLFHLFGERGIKFVMNFAAYPYVPDSFDRPLHVCDVNFMGAIKVINAAQEAGCEAVLQVSSAEIYGNAGTLRTWGSGVGWGEESKKIDESDDVQPHSSYGVAKAAVDNYCQVTWRERKTPVISLRQFNCVGERDETHPYIIPEIIKQLSSQESAEGVVRLGNNSFRDFMYAGDAVKIAVELLERGQFGECYNLGSEIGVKMYQLADVIARLMGFLHLKVELDESRVRPWEIWHLQSDNTKIKILGIDDPKTSLEESLKKTIEYMRSTNWRLRW